MIQVVNSVLEYGLVIIIIGFNTTFQTVFNKTLGRVKNTFLRYPLELYLNPYRRSRL